MPQLFTVSYTGQRVRIVGYGQDDNGKRNGWVGVQPVKKDGTDSKRYGWSMGVDHLIPVA